VVKSQIGHEPHREEDAEGKVLHARLMEYSWKMGFYTRLFVWY